MQWNSKKLKLRKMNGANVVFICLRRVISGLFSQCSRRLPALDILKRYLPHPFFSLPSYPPPNSFSSPFLPEEEGITVFFSSNFSVLNKQIRRQHAFWCIQIFKILQWNGKSKFFLSFIYYENENYNVKLYIQKVFFCKVIMIIFIFILEHWWGFML